MPYAGILMKCGFRISDLSWKKSEIRNPKSIRAYVICLETGGHKTPLMQNIGICRGSGMMLSCFKVNPAFKFLALRASEYNPVAFAATFANV
jgi:hypothetical protein